MYARLNPREPRTLVSTVCTCMRRSDSDHSFHSLHCYRRHTSTGQHDTHTTPSDTPLAPHVPTCVHHASVRLPSSSLHSPARRQFSPATTISRFHRTVSPPSIQRRRRRDIVVISMCCSVYACNSIVAAASLLMLQRRLGNFPVFSLIFPLICSPLHRSCIDHSECGTHSPHRCCSCHLLIRLAHLHELDSRIARSALNRLGIDDHDG
jgi:hypothetical protein